MSGRGLAQKTLDLIAVCYEILETEQPLTVRGVCYRLFNRKLIPDMGKNSTARVSTVLTTARERGMIDWSWIVDERPKGWALRIDPATNPDVFALAAEQFGRAVRPRDVVMVVVQGDPATGGR